MAELDAQQSPPPAAARSRKLAAAVIILAILPPLLLFPFALVELKWLYPVFQEHLRQCVSFDCGIQTETDWERLGWLLILGPSFLVAVASLLLGTPGFVRERGRATSPKDRALFRASVACGVVWIVLLGCLYGVIFWITGVVP